MSVLEDNVALFFALYGPGAIPLIPSFTHFLLYLLISFTFLDQLFTVGISYKHCCHLLTTEKSFVAQTSRSLLSNHYVLSFVEDS